MSNGTKGAIKHPGFRIFELWRYRLDKKKKIFLNDTGTGRPSFKGEYDEEIVDAIISAARKFGVDPKIALGVGLQETGLGKYGEPFQGANPLKMNYDMLINKTYGKIFPETAGYENRLEKLREAISQREAAIGRGSASGAPLPTLLKEMDERDRLRMVEKKISERYKQVWEDSNFDDPIFVAVRFLKQKMENAPYRTSLAHQIQAYNGYGKLKEASLIGHHRKYYGVAVEDIDTRKTPIYGHRIIDLMQNVIDQSPELKRKIGGKE